MVPKTHLAQRNEALGTHFPIEFEEIISPVRQKLPRDGRFYFCQKLSNLLEKADYLCQN